MKKSVSYNWFNGWDLSLCSLKCQTLAKILQILCARPPLLTGRLVVAERGRDRGCPGRVPRWRLLYTDSGISISTCSCCRSRLSRSHWIVTIRSVPLVVHLGVAQPASEVRFDLVVIEIIGDVVVVPVAPWRLWLLPNLPLALNLDLSRSRSEWLEWTLSTRRRRIEPSAQAMPAQGDTPGGRPGGIFASLLECILPPVLLRHLPARSRWSLLCKLSDGLKCTVCDCRVCWASAAG